MLVIVALRYEGRGDIQFVWLGMRVDKCHDGTATLQRGIVQVQGYVGLRHSARQVVIDFMSLTILRGLRWRASYSGYEGPATSTLMIRN